MTASPKEALSDIYSATSERNFRSSGHLKYQCRYRPGLKFSNSDGCKATRVRIDENPSYIDMLGCRNCSGPLPLKDHGEQTMSSNEEETHKTVETSTEPKMCKCGRGRVVIRKNGTSAGRCRQCMSDVAKKWSKGKSQSKKKNDVKSIEAATVLDAHVLLELLKERKEEAESLVNNLIENDVLSGDKDIAKTIISFVKFMATMDVVLKTETLENNNPKD